MIRPKQFIILVITVLSLLFPTLMWAEVKKPFISIKEVQAPLGVDFSFSIGVGFLYFKNLKGNLSPIPTQSFPSYTGTNFGKIPGFSYNKTPLFEAMLTKRILPWLKCGLSLYGQSEVSIESYTQASLTRSDNTAYSQFRSNLQLYAVLFKFFIENPYPLRIKNMIINPYLGLGVGPSWQSWTNNQVYESLISQNGYSSTTLSLNNKFSANATWTADAGIYLQPATDQSTMKVRLGCKYTDWGQMRQIGAMKNQNTKLAPFKPIQAKKVYSFAPYVGVSWCF